MSVKVWLVTDDDDIHIYKSSTHTNNFIVFTSTMKKHLEWPPRHVTAVSPTHSVPPILQKENMPVTKLAPSTPSTTLTVPRSCCGGSGTRVTYCGTFPCLRSRGRKQPVWGSPGAPMLSYCTVSLLTDFSVMAYSDGSKTVVHEIVGHTVHDSFQ